MAAEPEIDFSRAEATRASMARDLSSRLDADIAQAVARADSPDWHLARPFQIVPSWGDLRGPAGPVDLPEAWRAGLPARVDAEEDLVQLYARVLVSGSPAEQAELLHPQRLIDAWPALTELLPPPVSGAWENRFPELSG
ncbi:hypothetical protein [Streptomyces sp. 7N604]|uniref:hypothetical protein n=1 Tax=Streptomyces sp. 7N604 TaxID=3457415 RepID=UPI003FD61906